MMKIGKTFLTKIFWVEILPTKPKISGEIPRFKKSFGNCQGECSSQGSPNTSVEIPFQHLFWGKCHWGFLYFCSFIMEIPSPLVEKIFQGKFRNLKKKQKPPKFSRVWERTQPSLGENSRVWEIPQKSQKSQGVQMELSLLFLGFPKIRAWSQSVESGRHLKSSKIQSILLKSAESENIPSHLLCDYCFLAKAILALRSTKKNHGKAKQRGGETSCEGDW